MSKKKKSKSAKNIFVAVCLFIFKILWSILKGMGLGIFWVFKKGTKKIEAKQKKDELIKKQNALQTIEPIVNITSDEKGFDEFQNDLHKDSLMIIILGRRGSGKSALAHSVAQQMATHQKKQIVTFNEPKQISNLANYDDISKIPNDSIVILDEAGIHFSGRSSGAKQNKDMLNQLRISRHRGISTIVISQDSGSVDVGFLRLADYILMKRITQSMFDFERSAIQKRLKPGYEALNEKKGEKEFFYVASDDFNGLCKNKLASYWSNKASKSYK